MGVSFPPPTFVEESVLYRQGYRLIAGIDEAGRGPLAGPVVAGAVIFPDDFNPPWLNGIRDSKQLSPGRRDKLFSCIQESGIAWGSGVVSHQDIDSLGIVPATRKAMILAMQHLPERPDFLLVDALPISQSGMAFKAIIKGDQRSLSIAAASIVAKVTRDRIMVEEDLTYPGYDFALHKGYPTRAHMESLQRLGPCPIHRRSFAPVRALVDGGIVRSARSKNCVNLDTKPPGDT
jgi:ribonuclease HII